MIDNKNKSTLSKKIVTNLTCILVGLTPECSFAIDPFLPPAPASEASPPSAVPPTPAATAPAPVQKFTQAELETLVT